MGQSSLHPSSALDHVSIHEGRIQGDIACLQCGYDLRSLPIDSHCPECGTSVEVSLRRDNLAQSDPAYIRRLQIAALLSLFGVVLMLPLFYLGQLIASVGLVLMATKQPNRVEPRNDRWQRYCLQGLLILGNLLIFGVAISVAYTFIINHARITHLINQSFYIDGLLIIGHGFMFLAMLIASLHIENLARRIGDAFNAPDLVKRCARVRRRWFIGFGLAVSATFILNLDVYLIHSNTMFFAPRFVIWIAIATVGLLWMWIEGLRLLVSWQRLLRQVSASTRCTA